MHKEGRKTVPSLLQRIYFEANLVKEFGIGFSIGVLLVLRI
jgi:hypothetical protein